MTMQHSIASSSRVVLLPVAFYRRVLSPMKRTPTCRYLADVLGVRDRSRAQARESSSVARSRRGGCCAAIRCFHGGYDPVPRRREGASLDAGSRQAAAARGRARARRDVRVADVLPRRRSRRSRSETPARATMAPRRSARSTPSAMTRRSATTAPRRRRAVPSS